ncbi:MAG: spermidine/putrescine ABC transporter substrate-binding protein PotF, partial [Rhodobacteraceae bacterium]|nr:spermidine/putrescine ABC transporter substrate-binding protein PotF [Paracoccaceae bacterium]
NFVGYANANLAATPFVDEAVRNNAAIYPNEEIKSRLWVPKPETPEMERLVTRIWSDIKSSS